MNVGVSTEMNKIILAIACYESWSDSPRSPPVDHEFEDSVPIRDPERLGVKAAISNVSSKIDTGANMWIKHGEVQLKVVNVYWNPSR
jgi:hypothetical protein